MSRTSNLFSILPLQAYRECDGLVKHWMIFVVMSSSDLSENSDQVNTSVSTSKKRKKLGRICDVNKKLRLQSHEQGDPCNCKKRYFQKIGVNERKSIMKHMNSMNSVDELNLF